MRLDSSQTLAVIVGTAGALAGAAFTYAHTLGGRGLLAGSILGLVIFLYTGRGR